MKPSSKALDGAVVAYLCNFLEENDAKPWKVLKAAGLAPKTDADWHTADAVNALYTADQRYMPQALNTDSEAASDAVLFAFSSGFSRGGLVTHNLSSLPGLAFFFL